MTRREEGRAAPGVLQSAARRRVLQAGAGAVTGLVLGAGRQAGAEGTYPERPVRVVVPWPAGGVSDSGTRRIAAVMEKFLGGRILVENRPGASATIGAEAIARATPDGHTIGMLGNNHTLLVALGQKTSYDLLRDFAPLMRVAVLDNVVVVHPSVPARTLKEFVALAKAHPQKYRYASGGSGGTTHLAAVQLSNVAGIELLHVPYKGGGAATADLLAGNVSLMIETITNAMTLVKTGKVRAIANSGSRRWSTAPDLPTFAEAGVPGYEVDSWTGLFVAAGTPAPIVERINSELVRAARDPGYRAAMSSIGVEAVSSTSKEFAAFVKAEMEKWARVVQLTGTKVD